MSKRAVHAVAMEGFKCFDDLRLELGQLTLVTGFNGGGKSTALQPLLLLAQALRFGTLDALPLNGPLVRLGTAGDIAPMGSERPMLLKVEGDDGSLAVRPTLQAGDRVLPTKSVPKSQLSPRLERALKTLSFLGAVRIGPEDAFPIPERVDTRDVGHDGRFAPYWFDRLADEDVDPRRHFVGEEAAIFRRQIDAWLGSLFPGAEANVQNVIAVSQMNLQFRLAELGSWRRPSNIGYGLTYAFPILVALLGAAPDQVILIDSPESHLHPSAQSQMGRILATLASAGVQIVIETHSDHLLNGVRLAVRDGALLPEDLRIHFFQGPNGKEHGVTTPGIGTGGEIYEWPEGFFDQGEKDLSRLAGWS
ncbi:AAA family ATPase [Oryzicola mucosus]|uniref:CRISPR-associated protein Cas5 n=1 Tax=Oryzicola mucosus TaxID=2767425 RepID=A0A8J6PZJ6_9HYPH|nr:CRISPR-associated protein Cas5 [Oryzicola mucosus]MBD0417152.1 CRISPR-associated protein Cas5 [Oryzicola mucosus]